MTETFNFVAGLCAAVLSLILAYVPSVAVKFNRLDGFSKRVIIAVSSLSVVIVLALGSCAGLNKLVPCSNSSWLALAQAFCYAIVGSQTAYTFLVRKDTQEG